MLRHICSFFNCGGEITSYSVGVAALYIVGANAVAVTLNKSAMQLNGVPAKQIRLTIKQTLQYNIPYLQSKYNKTL